MLLPFYSQQCPKVLHPRVEVHPNAQLRFPSDCQVEDKQRGVCEPRNPVAAAVPEECYQQDEEIQTGQLKPVVSPLSPCPGLGPPSQIVACSVI